MKHLLPKLALTCAALTLASFAHADGRLVEFTQYGYVQDVACAIPDDVDVYDNLRLATYEIKNFGPTKVELNIKVDNFDDFPNDLITFQAVSCADGSISEGATEVPASLDSGASCVIELLITPPTCPVINYLDPMDKDAIFGPLNGPLKRLLEIDINTRQVELSTRIRAKVSTLGAAAEFGLLGVEIDNDNDSGPTQVDNGSVGAGILGEIIIACFIEGRNTNDYSGIFGEVQVINGTKYLEYDALPTLIAMEDLDSTLDMFETQFENGSCISPQSTNADPDDLSGVILGPNTYCLDGQYVQDLQTLTLSGAGQYVFFVYDDAREIPYAKTNHRKDSNCSTLDYGFCLGENASVVWANGAEVDDIFWIDENFDLQLYVNSSLAGNVLSYEGLAPFFDDVGQVNGRMLTLGCLSLSGNSITVK